MDDSPHDHLIGCLRLSYMGVAISERQELVLGA